MSRIRNGERLQGKDSGYGEKAEAVEGDGEDAESSRQIGGPREYEVDDETVRWVLENEVLEVLREDVNAFEDCHESWVIDGTVKKVLDAVGGAGLFGREVEDL